MRKWLILLLLGFFGSVILASDTASAAPPSLILSHGVVNSSQTAAFLPAAQGPVAFSGSGACSRWSGIIDRTALTNQPVNSDIISSQLDAGDVVTFAIVLRNTSVDGNAYDVAVNNPLPDGFELPGTGVEGANMCVTRGDNMAQSFTSNGSGFFGTTDGDNIELLDTGSGSIAPTSPTSGQDIIVITYDLVVAPHHVPNSIKPSVANLLFYSATEGGALIEGSDDAASVKMGTFGRTKTLLASNQSFTAGNLVVIGEQLTYRLTVQVPQGQIDTVSIADTMTPGLVFLGCDSIVNDDSASLSANLAGGIGAACNDPTNPTVASDGRIITFDLGQLTNTDRNDNNPETITITYRVVVANHIASINGATLNNSAVVQWEGNNSAASDSAAVMVREAQLMTDVTVSPNQSVREGDRVLVTLTIAHQSPGNAPAFDVLLSHLLPNGLVPDGSTLQCNGGNLMPNVCAFSGNALEAEWDSIGVTQTSVLSFEAVANSSAAGQTLSLPVNATWSSLAGSQVIPQSFYSGLTTERTGSTNDPGGVQNDYRLATQTSLVVASMSGNTDVASSNGQSDTSSQSGRLADTGMDTAVVIAAATLLLLIGVVAGLVGIRQLSA